MTIGQILKTIDKTIAAKVAKLPIREVEEESKGHWVAYVDEGKASHDVHIILKGKQVEQAQCDCGANEEQICQHKARLLMSLEDALKGKKIVEKPLTKKILTKKKVSESVALLQDVNQEEVYTWLAELFKKNKEVEQEFVLKFGKVEVRDYTMEEVDTIMKDILLATIGKKKKEASAKEIKTVVDLFTLALAPVQEFLVVNISKPIALDIYFIVLFRLFVFNNSIYHSSTRIGTFKSKFETQFLRILFNVKDSEVIEKQLTLLKEKLQNEEGNVEFFVWWNLLSAVEKEVTDECLPHYISILIELKVFFDEYETNSKVIKGINRLLFNTLVKNNLFEQYYKVLTPVLYDEEYNLSLIQRIIDVDLVYAEGICIEIIEEELHLFSDDPVKAILAEIQTKLGKENKVFEMKMEKFFENINVEDYKYILNNIKNVKEKKTFKAKVLEKLKSMNVFGNRSSIYFELLSLDKEYREMINGCNKETSLELVYKYVKKMHQADAKLFLDKVMSIGKEQKGLSASCGLLALFVVENYSNKEVLEKLMKYGFKKGTLNEQIKAYLTVV